MSWKKNKGGAKQAGGQATKPKGTQVKSLSASASRPSDKDTQKKNKGGAKHAGGRATKPKGTQVKSLSASASGPSDKDTQK